MILQTSIGNYKWVENWIKIPNSPSSSSNGRTHGIAVLQNGNVVIFHQADPAVLIYSSSGQLLNSWGTFPGAHGLTVVVESGVEFLWLVDETTKEVVKTTIDGDVLMRLNQPPNPLYKTGAYVPTWLAVAEERFGGNGDLWLADGYGCSLVHRFDTSGNYLDSLNGETGAGRFNCPHGVAIDTRRSELEFYIADRGNARFQVFAPDGSYLRTFGEGFLNSPDVSVVASKYLIVPELTAGITILDETNKLVASLGFNQKAPTFEGWPNERRWIAEGKFNSPHSAAADSQGNIYVVEWITGGRVTKLERC